MRIQHNIAALNSYRQLNTNNNAVAKNLEKLSSGYRINRAGDDAAGLAISEKMRAQISGLEMATKNAQDGISLIQTGEGALQESHSILQRMRELAVQSSNGIYDNETDRANLDKEITALKSELDRISTATDFNGIKLLDGSQAAGAVKGVTVGDLTAGTDVAAKNDVSIKETKFDGTPTGIKIGSELIQEVGADTNKIEAVQTNPTNGANITASMAGTITSSMGTSSALASTIVSINATGMAQLGGASAAGSTVTEAGGLAAVKGKLEGMEIKIVGTGGSTTWKVTFDNDLANSGNGNYINLSGTTAGSNFTDITTKLYTQLASEINSSSSLTGVSANMNAAGTGLILTNSASGGTGVAGANPPTIRFNEASKPASTVLHIKADGVSGAGGFQNGSSITVDGKTFIFTDDNTKTDDAANNTYYVNLDQLGATTGTAGLGGLDAAPTKEQMTIALFEKMKSVDPDILTGANGLKVELSTTGSSLIFTNTNNALTPPDVRVSVAKGTNVASKIDFGAKDGAASALWGSSLTINDGQGHEMTFEFAKSGTAVKDGNIRVDIAQGASSAAIATALKNAAEARGFDIKTGASVGTLLVGSNGHNVVAYAKDTPGNSKTTLDVNLKDLTKYEVGSTFTIKGKNGDTVFEFVENAGDETKIKNAVAVVLDSSAASNAANLLNAIQGGGADNNKLTAQERFAFSQNDGILSADRSKFNGKIVAAGAGVAAVSSESRTFRLDTSLKEGTVLDVNGQKYEFTYGDEASDGNNTAVKISPNSTSQEMMKAFVDAYNQQNVDTPADQKYTASLVKNKDGGVDIKLTADAPGAKQSNISIISSNNGEEGITFQIGANGAADQRVSLQIDDMSTNGLGLTDISIATQEEANAAIDKLDSAINKVSGTRADLGALQNRMEHTINNLSVNSENLTAAESRIRDVDVAKEMMAFTKNNILVQSAQAMLAQANQIPQGVLQLLG